MTPGVAQHGRTHLRRTADRHGHLVAGAATALLTVALLAGEIRRSYSYDEGVTVGEIISTGSPVTAFNTVVVFNNHMTFSAVQAVWWSLGASTEASQRVLPILYAAAAVGLLTAWTSRRWGILAGAAGGLVLMTNPMFVGVSRDIRGYSLSVLASVVAIVSLVEYLERRRTWLLVTHGFALVVAVTTHALVIVSLVPLAAAALVLTRARDRRLWLTWAASVTVAVLAYLPTIGELLDVRAERGSDYKPWWFRTTTWELLGRDRLTAAIVAAMALGGALIYAARRADRRVATAAAVVAVPLQMWIWWQIVQPASLEPRFVVSLVPLASLGVALCIRFVPVTSVAVVVALAAVAPHTAEVRRDQLPLREVATMVNDARNAGRTVCALGGWALAPYAQPPAEVVIPPAPVADGDAALAFGDCEMFVKIGGWGQTLTPLAQSWYAERDRVGPIDIYTGS